MILYPANIYMFKVNNRNTRKRCEISSKLTVKTSEQHHLCHPGGFHCASAADLLGKCQLSKYLIRLSFTSGQCFYQSSSKFWHFINTKFQCLVLLQKKVCCVVPYYGTVLKRLTKISGIHVSPLQEYYHRHTRIYQASQKGIFLGFLPIIYAKSSITDV